MQFHIAIGVWVSVRTLHRFHQLLLCLEFEKKKHFLFHHRDDYKELGSVVPVIIGIVALTAAAIGARKLSIISTKLLCVPVTRPKPPITIKTRFRITTQLKRPNLSGYNTQISIIDGNAMPRTDKHNAPNSEINNAKRGTDIASKTVSMQNKVKNYILETGSVEYFFRF